MRYSLLLDAVGEKQPDTIVEIGTWNGVRALEMLARSPGSRYIGFDLFEDADEKTDADEKNVKQHIPMAYVQHVLSGFNATLIRGNTRETLRELDEPVDFAWIDGGHSVATIASDWANLKRLLVPGAVVLFDDYYSGPIDTARFGCNQVVKDLPHEVLPAADPVAGGGWTQIVRVCIGG